MSSSSSASLLPLVSRPRFHSVSTGVRPPLSISTLARASANPDCTSPTQSYSLSDTSCASPSKCPTSPVPAFILPPLPDQKTSAEATRAYLRNMFPVLVSRSVDLWRSIRGSDSKHATNFLSSPMSSPRSSTDTEYILPLSSSAQKTAFDGADLAPLQRRGALYRLTPFPMSHAPLLFVVVLFPISSAVVFFCLTSLPIAFAWPRTLSDLAQLGRDLSTYSQSGPAPTVHIISVLAVSAVWKHAWSIPGSVLWNVLAGALFHPFLATLLMTLLTSLGSVLATLLATPLAPVLTRIFPRPVELTRAALEGSTFSGAGPTETETETETVESEAEEVMTSSAAAVTTVSTASSSSPPWVRLSILRLVGIVPWSALNIACGLTGVALRDCIAGAFIGSLPWTAVTCQIGDIIQTVSKASSSAEIGLDEGLSKSATVSSVLARPSMILELVFLTVLSLAPILFRDRLRKLISSSDENAVEAVEMESSEEKGTLVRPMRKERSTGLGVPSMGVEEDDELLGRGRRMRRQRWTWQRVSMSIPRWSALNSPLRASFPKVDQGGNQ